MAAVQHRLAVKGQRIAGAIIKVCGDVRQSLSSYAIRPNAARWLFSALLCGLSLPIAYAQTGSVSSVQTRTAENSSAVTALIAAHVSADRPVRHGVVVARTAAQPGLKLGDTKVDAIGPWIRGAPALAEQGIAVLYLDVPSDAAGRAIDSRPRADVQRDLEAAVAVARKQTPNAAIHLGALGATPQFLDAAGRVKDISRVVLVSAGLVDARDLSFPSLASRTMLVHAPSSGCDYAPYLDAEYVAHQNSFVFVPAGYPRAEVERACGSASHHALAGLEKEFAQVVADRLDGRSVASRIGHALPSLAWRERIVTYDVPSLFGRTRMEMTLWLPDLTEPVPVVVFNHGDVHIDRPEVKYKRRVRDMRVAREFLRLGVAVAMPARRGVGLSQGTYPRPASFSSNDADATYKARVHADDILPALDYLRGRPEINSQQILVAGQSAGGYAAMYIASQKPPGVVGVINFSGGRTDVVGAAVAEKDRVNRMMVSGFREFGQIIRVPALFVFAENDSLYSTATIRPSHSAFLESGGQAQLILAGPSGKDGHMVYHQPELWRSALKGYLARIGLQ
jgi:dienelactone hydrolase